MLSAPVLLCPLVSARGVRNLLKSLEFFDRRASRVGLITRRSQVQILAPLQKFRSLTIQIALLRRPSFRMRES